MKKLLFVLFVVLLTTHLKCQDLPIIGKRMPTIPVLDINGNSAFIKPDMNTGKPYIIVTWHHWNSFSVRMLQNLNAVYAEWQNQTGVKIIALHSDKAENIPAAKNTISQKGWNFTYFFDPELKGFCNAFDVKPRGAPEIIICNSKADIMWDNVGYVSPEVVYAELLKVVSNPELTSKTTQTTSKTTYIPPAAKPLPFIDDFTDNKNGWWTGDDQNASGSLSNGKYLLQGKGKPIWNSFIPLQIDATRDFKIYCEIQQLSNTTNLFGIVFGHQNGENFYDFLADKEGHIVIRKCINGSLSFIKSASEPNIDPFCPKCDWKRFLIRKVGNKIYFSLNGTLIRTAAFTGLPGNEIGFSFWNNVSISVKNFKVEYTQPLTFNIKNNSSKTVKVAVAFIYTNDGITKLYNCEGWYSVKSGTSLVPNIDAELLEKISYSYIYAMTSKDELKSYDDLSILSNTTVWKIDPINSFRYQGKPVETDLYGQHDNGNKYYRSFRPCGFNYTIEDGELKPQSK